MEEVPRLFGHLQTAIARVRLGPEQQRLVWLTLQASVWLLFAARHSRQPLHALCAKALEAIVFSFARGAHSLAVPSKLIGVAAFQESLRALRSAGTPAGIRFELGEEDGRLVTTYGPYRLGYVQAKHAWLRRLRPFGAAVHLLRVTGEDRHTLGLNVAFCGLTEAICRALGEPETR